MSPYECEVCLRHFPTLSTLDHHLRNFHGPRVPSPSSTSRLFGRSAQKRKDAPWSCEDCNRQFEKSSDLLNHLRDSGRHRYPGRKSTAAVPAINITINISPSSEELNSTAQLPNNEGTITVSVVPRGHIPGGSSGSRGQILQQRPAATTVNDTSINSDGLLDASPPQTLQHAWHILLPIPQSPPAPPRRNAENANNSPLSSLNPLTSLPLNDPSPDTRRRLRTLMTPDRAFNANHSPEPLSPAADCHEASVSQLTNEDGIAQDSTPTRAAAVPLPDTPGNTNNWRSPPTTLSPSPTRPEDSYSPPSFLRDPGESSPPVNDASSPLGSGTPRSTPHTISSASLAAAVPLPPDPSSIPAPAFLSPPLGAHTLPPSDYPSPGTTRRLLGFTRENTYDYPSVSSQEQVYIPRNPTTSPYEESRRAQQTGHTLNPESRPGRTANQSRFPSENSLLRRNLSFSSMVGDCPWSASSSYTFPNPDSDNILLSSSSSIPPFAPTESEDVSMNDAGPRSFLSLSSTDGSPVTPVIPLPLHIQVHHLFDTGSLTHSPRVEPLVFLTPFPDTAELNLLSPKLQSIVITCPNTPSFTVSPLGLDYLVMPRASYAVNEIETETEIEIENQIDPMTSNFSMRGHPSPTSIITVALPSPESRPIFEFESFSPIYDSDRVAAHAGEHVENRTEASHLGFDSVLVDPIVSLPPLMGRTTFSGATTPIHSFESNGSPIAIRVPLVGDNNNSSPVSLERFPPDEEDGARHSVIDDPEATLVHPGMELPLSSGPSYSPSFLSDLDSDREWDIGTPNTVFDWQPSFPEAERSILRISESDFFASRGSDAPLTVSPHPEGTEEIIVSQEYGISDIRRLDDPVTRSEEAASAELWRTELEGRVGEISRSPERFDYPRRDAEPHGEALLEVSDSGRSNAARNVPDLLAWRATARSAEERQQSDTRYTIAEAASHSSPLAPDHERTNRRRLTCPICYTEDVQEPITTRCGHVFCEGCIYKALLLTITSGCRPSCPYCRRNISSLGDLIRIYLI